MAETFTPKTWLDDPAGATPITAAELNRIETGIETIDDRAAALELGITTPVTITYAATITPNATQGSLFRCTATGNLTLNEPSGGLNGQTVTVEITASGADQTLTVGAATTTIPSGQVWVGTLRYNSGTTTWVLSDGGGGGGGGGSGVTSVNGRSGIVTGLAEATHVHAATDVTSGTFAPSRLGSGTADSSTVLHGDSVFRAVTAAPQTTVTANLQTGTSYTLALVDAGRVVERNNASANTTTIPTNATVAFPVGTVIEVFQYGAGTSSVVAASGVTILPGPSPVAIASRYQSLSLRQRVANEWVVT